MSVLRKSKQYDVHKKIKNKYIGRMYSILFVLFGSSFLLYSCFQIKNSSDSANKDIKFYVQNVEKTRVVKNSVILEATNFNAKTNIPEVNWVNKLGNPQQWLVLMYKRGSSDIFFSSIIDGGSATKPAGVADYFSNSNFDTNANFPVEYRISVTRIEKGTWAIQSSGNITVSEKNSKNSITLSKQAQIDISQHGEKEYTIRIEGENALDSIEANAKKITDESFSGTTAGIPLVKFPSAFVVTSSSLDNGASIGEVPNKAGFKHSSGNCSGYIGESVSPALDWSSKTAASNNSTFVVLAYDPVQKNPVGGTADLNEPAAAPYYSLWFQYNIPATVKSIVEGNAGNGTDKKTDKDNPLFDNIVAPSAGEISHNVYSRSANSLLSLYTLGLCYSDKDAKDKPLPIRKRYDGPLPNPYSGRHYIRFVVFELNAGNIKVFKDSSAESIAQNISDSKTSRDELEEFSFGHGVSGSAVDTLVQNFIDLDRTKIRNNDFTNLDIQHKDGRVTVLGASVLLFAMDAPFVPF